MLSDNLLQDRETCIAFNYNEANGDLKNRLANPCGYKLVQDIVEQEYKRYEPLFNLPGVEQKSKNHKLCFMVGLREAVKLNIKRYETRNTSGMGGLDLSPRQADFLIGSVSSQHSVERGYLEALMTVCNDLIRTTDNGENGISFDGAPFEQRFKDSFLTTDGIKPDLSRDSQNIVVYGSC
jgi:hypothetical protein